jgi:predicted alpha/beta-fold hydrolase
MREISISGIERINTLKEFDDQYTAPMHGFKDAHDYYQRCSSNAFVQKIRIPTIILNALNDPFLSKTCYPIKSLEGHSYVKLETPSRGGHVGFTLFDKNGVYWSERRAMEFIMAKKVK